MRRLIFTLCLVLTIAVIAGCSGNSDSTSSEFTYEPEFKLMFSIPNEGVFDTGYYCIKTEYDMTLYFENKGNADVTWSIYILDSKIDDSDYDSLLSKSPALVNNGSLVVAEDKWICVCCDCNSRTAESPSDGYIECGYYEYYEEIE